ncbi:MAG: DUF1893 domain-containing protein [Oscillospiraceae bacterium]|nr:DUF1893 domain-containing protein [Oscillospiraceae bacterium]
MKADLQKAKALLQDKDYTCVICKGEQIYTSRKRGVAPLLEWLEQKTDLSGYSAADKVVGRAAAFLYLLLGISRLHACVISSLALQVLEQSGITCEYDLLVPAIRNRAGDGFCPMESAVEELKKPEEALCAIRDTLQKLKNQ